MGLHRSAVHEAVYFFENSRFGRGMLYKEFEALLDGVFRMPAFAGQQMKSAFLVIDPSLRLRSLVCFLLNFDADGVPDRTWKLPVHRLAEQPVPGPDFGYGAIGIISRSHCSTPAVRGQLWEPTAAELKTLEDSVRRNTLRLPFHDVVPLLDAREPVSVDAPRLDDEALSQAAIAWVTEQRDQQQAQKVAQIEKRHRADLAELRSRHAEELARVRSAELARQRLLEREISELKDALSRQQRVETDYQLRLTAQSDAAARARDRFDRDLQAMQQHTRREAALGRAQMEEAFQQKVGQLLQRSERSALERLATAGVVFVSYQPGAGHMTLSVSELEVYCQNPAAYAAARCGLQEADYRRWLAHYLRPQCGATCADGRPCQGAVTRIGSPGHFVAGESDRCTMHQVAKAALHAG